MLIVLVESIRNRDRADNAEGRTLDRKRGRAEEETPLNLRIICNGGPC
jgi:hypothetical protein